MSQNDDEYGGDDDKPPRMPEDDPRGGHEITTLRGSGHKQPKDGDNGGKKPKK